MSESIESFVTRCAATIRWHMEQLPPGGPTIRTQSPEDTDCSGIILAGCRANGWYLFADGYPSKTVKVDGEDVEVFDHFRVFGPAALVAQIQAVVVERGTP